VPSTPTEFCATYGAVPVATATNTTCPYAGDGECDDGGPGAVFSECPFGSDYPDCVSPPRGYSCQCPAGSMWDMNNENCISMHWQARAYDADTLTASNYFNSLESTLMAASVYMKPADKWNDVLSRLQARECSLLYNSVNGYSFTDTVHVVNSPRNRFLRAWGMASTIDIGAADDPCSGYGNTTAS